MNFIKTPHNPCASPRFPLASPNKIWLLKFFSDPPCMAEFHPSAGLLLTKQYLLCFVQFGCKWLNQCDLQKYLLDDYSVAFTGNMKHLPSIRTLYKNKFTNWTNGYLFQRRGNWDSSLYKITQKVTSGIMLKKLIYCYSHAQAARSCQNIFCAKSHFSPWLLCHYATLYPFYYS